MDDDIRAWVKKFQKDWEEKPIEYLDEGGNWKQDSDPLFSSISNAIQSREYELSVDELLRISQWKLQSGRNDSNIKENSSKEVAQQLQIAQEVSTDKEAIDALTELSGIGVPMASTVLTVSEPSKYAIIDYRAFRGLAGLKPDIVEFPKYTEYAEFLEHFRTYLKSPEAYEYYMNHVREIADAEGVSAREVDMALWAFDNEMA
ncbi:hypothetical protein QA600_21525 [Natronococcus sp. A-GB1]|uniref:hypothetical protein n=1 Tax=Natronococcus sp. A-GB1 TaxID=3037648 RepID=UPI00241DB77E|nr:hypothetical protein [Natronococcus sp. A-GB1]MDG5761905.1 hypothetical protein [Natronococcus sp. A-GB1]